MRVTLREVTRRYPGLTALDAVDLQIEDGTSVALTGPSGAGKSTVLHLAGGMDRPDSGAVEIDGEELTARRLDAHRRRTGFVFQRFHLLPALTALDNVLAPVLPRRVDSAAASGGWRCSPRSAWPSGPGRCRRSCPAASGNAWRSRGRW
jgi:putative ABC transport system ATP-binding protein